MWNPVTHGRCDRIAPAAAGWGRRVARPERNATWRVSSARNPPGLAHRSPGRSSRGSHASPGGRGNPRPSVPRSAAETNACPTRRPPPAATAAPARAWPVSAEARPGAPPHETKARDTPTGTTRHGQHRAAPDPADSSAHADKSYADPAHATPCCDGGLTPPRSPTPSTPPPTTTRSELAHPCVNRCPDIQPHSRSLPTESVATTRLSSPRRGLPHSCMITKRSGAWAAALGGWECRRASRV